MVEFGRGGGRGRYGGCGFGTGTGGGGWLFDGRMGGCVDVGMMRMGIGDTGTS